MTDERILLFLLHTKTKARMIQKGCGGGLSRLARKRVCVFIKPRRERENRTDGGRRWEEMALFTLHQANKE